MKRGMILGSTRRPERRIQATLEQGEQGRLERLARKAAWKPVRQPHTDDWDYLKGILKARGIARVEEAEPATVRRLAKLIRRSGLTVSQAEEAVGLKLPVLIERNPEHALWWLLATTLEAAG